MMISDPPPPTADIKRAFDALKRRARDYEAMARKVSADVADLYRDQAHCDRLSIKRLAKWLGEDPE